MRVLVIGAGMYVTGRNGSANGTVLATLAQISKNSPISAVDIVAKDPANKFHVDEARKRINTKLGTNLQVNYIKLINSLEADLPDLVRSGAYTLAIIAIPDHLHYQALKTLMPLGLPCLVVKPFVASVAEAVELINIQRAAKVYSAVEFHKRFDEQNRYAKSILSTNELGQIQYILVEFSQRIDIPTRWFKDWISDTNVFQYLGVHYVDLIHFLTRYVPTRVMGVGVRGALAVRGLDAFDAIHASIVWQDPSNAKNSFISHIATNWIDSSASAAMSDQKYKIIGTQGRIEMDQGYRGITVVSDSLGNREPNPYFSEFLPNIDGGQSFIGYGMQSIAQFVCDVLALQSGKVTLEFLEENRPSFISALISTAVLEAVNKSLFANSEWFDVNATLR